MTENEPERQDPAEPKRVDTETETAPQAEPTPEPSQGPEEPADAAGVEVSPEDPGGEAVVVEPEPELKAETTRVFDTDYEVSPERGYRAVKA